ncbi:FadR/GntR family transcriptional regulator [Paeniglutamicibacter sp.]|uniref:FadR/GntR family transcriptional regulator n=1 Tax=Paeniglutamicibacter sp. TaxID=1934391 RepID=UPI00398A072C
MLYLHVASSGLPVSEIVEARILLETWAARAAAQRQNPADLEPARDLLAAMDKPDIDPEEFHALDAQFHLAFRALAGNTVIETIMESLSGSIRGYIKGALASLGQWPVVLQSLRDQHHAILDAVEAGNGDMAAGLLRDHVAWLYERTRDTE